MVQTRFCQWEPNVMHEIDLASCHPVDALKHFAERAGLQIDPDSEAKMREICDAPATLADHQPSG